MTAKIDGPRLAPAAGGAPQQLVIFLHGYGADGNDLIGLGREWARALPHAAFVSPNAPEEMPSGFFGGRQWFALDTRAEHEWENGVRRAQPVLEAFIHAEAARHKLPLSAVALVGFSQGTMMALQTGLRLSETPAAIVGFSGHLAESGTARRRDQVQAARAFAPRLQRRSHPRRRDPSCQGSARRSWRARRMACQARPRPRHRS